ncbi:hypothetical protein P5V15_014292 [Pogonomyrmex californicus]
MDGGGGGATIGEDGVYYARVGRRDCVVRHGTARHGAGREKNSISETVRVCMVAESRERYLEAHQSGFSKRQKHNILIRLGQKDSIGKERKKCGEHGKSHNTVRLFYSLNPKPLFTVSDL